MNPEGILDFVRARRLAVVATVSESGMPEAALMGIAVTSDERIVFDTVKSSRKYANLCARNGIALVVGWEEEITVQLEGIAEEPTGIDLEFCKDAYFVAPRRPRATRLARHRLHRGAPHVDALLRLRRVGDRNRRTHASSSRRFTGQAYG